MVSESIKLMRRWDVVPSLFILTSLCLISFTVLLGLMVTDPFIKANPVASVRLFDTLLASLWFSLRALTLTIPISLTFCFLLVSREWTEKGRKLRRAFWLTGQWPALLLAPLFLYWPGSVETLGILSLAWFMVPHLTRRWIWHSKRVQRQDLDSFRSLGATYRQVTQELYLRPLFWGYVRHAMVVMVYSILVVSPFLWLSYTWPKDVELLGHQFFLSVIQSPESGREYFLVLFTVYVLVFFLDESEIRGRGE